MSTVKLGDVAIESRDSLKEKDKSLPVVGLEHLIPEQINLTDWNIGQENTFTKTFEKGDVLFGRRRAYLKKAAVAPCKGICSGDITVIRSKEDKILAELLPFVIQNDIFFDYAVGKSAGSLSPRVKWEHLANYEFNLPELDEQKKLAEVLWQIVATMESYKKLLAKTDEMVKAKFVEMFGENKVDYIKLGDALKTTSGGTPSRKNNNYYDNGNIPWIQSGDLHQHYIISTKSFITEQGLDNSSAKLFLPNTVLLAMYGATVGECSILKMEACTNQAICALLPNEKYNPEFLYYFFKINQNKIIQKSIGGGQPNISQEIIRKLKIPVVEISEQTSFEKFAKETEESKSAIQASLDSLSAVYKKIIAENLGGR